MTRAALLALISARLGHVSLPTSGGTLFCHQPHIGKFSYVGRVYDPASAESIQRWGGSVRHTDSPYLSFLEQAANGLSIANIALFGIVATIDRTVSGHAGQPISLDYGNLVERPAHLQCSDLVVGSVVGWSSQGRYIMRPDGSVRLIHAHNADDVADEWASLPAMLESEITRIAEAHDEKGTCLSTATALMHPAGRRWETSIEPGTALH
jgi:hypothetical protein